MDGEKDEGRVNIERLMDDAFNLKGLAAILLDLAFEELDEGHRHKWQDVASGLEVLSAQIKRLAEGIHEIV